MLSSAARVLATLAVVGTRLAGVGAQQCALTTLFAHLSDIQAACCTDGNACSSSYPGEGDECSTECGEIFEPFWDSCGSMLTAMGVGGTEGMTTFYDSCLATLYPPGSCADDCTPSMMHCRVMEVQAACCGDPTNCPEGDSVPHSCPVGCALVFPFFLESCHDALAAQGSDVALYGNFSQACTRQDTTALVEYAIDLVDQGCTVELEGLRRLAEPEDVKKHVAQDIVADDSRRLQALGTGTCEGFIDDPSGDLAAHGVSCEQVLALGCDADLSRVQPTMARGSLVKFACPVSCEECHRKGIARWIETPNECPWDRIDDRLEVVNEACCTTDGADPDVACPRGGPPRVCSAVCAVTYHSLVMDCGEKLLSLAGEANAERFTAFDELCTSERSVDPMVFLDAIASATCCSADNCEGCFDETTCASAQQADLDLTTVCNWSDGECRDSPPISWVLLIRQHAGNYRSRAQWMHYNADSDHTNDQEDFSVLDTLESYRHDGQFELKILWPQESVRQVWRQSSNPVTQQCCDTGVTGYEPVEIAHTEQHWGGLEPSANGVLDGSASHGNWFYSIGSSGEWNGGIPAWEPATHEVELWVCSGSLNCPL